MVMFRKASPTPFNLALIESQRSLINIAVVRCRSLPFLIVSSTSRGCFLPRRSSTSCICALLEVFMLLVVILWFSPTAAYAVVTQPELNGASMVTRGHAEHASARGGVLCVP